MPFVISQGRQLERELAQSDVIAYDGNAIALRNFNMLKYYKLINTYQTDGYCAIIRYPNHESFLNHMFQPFDDYFWIFFILSLICACIVWKLHRRYRDGNSVGYFVFGIYAAFFLQAIPFRRNRPMQTFLLNVFVFMLFIIGNAYQGMMISILMDHNNDKYIQSVDDLVNRDDLKIYADIGLATAMNESYPELYAKLNIVYEWIESDAYFHQFRDLIVKNDHSQVLIVLCDFVDKLLDVKMCFGTARDYHYVMTDQILSFYNYMVAAKRSPFADRINEYSLRIFEGGIQQYWKVINGYRTYNPHLKKFDGIDFVNFATEYALVLGIGFGLATFAFIVEIICGRYGEQLKVAFIDFWKFMTRSNRVRPFRRPA
jgi:energy-coupling factor transporter transmembrane protein EcfT